MKDLISTSHKNLKKLPMTTSRTDEVHRERNEEQSQAALLVSRTRTLGTNRS